ncbi:MAG: hypothetical protein ACTS3R_03840 [Inquilinaceae bacterium]
MTALLGQPELRRREGAGELWQYRTAACVVDLFLYDGADGLTVTHAESRSRHTLGADAPDCLASVVAGAARPATTPTS